MKEFPLLFKHNVFVGSSFIGREKLVTAPSQNLCVDTPGSASSYNVGLGRTLTPDAEWLGEQGETEKTQSCMYIYVCVRLCGGIQRLTV